MLKKITMVILVSITMLNANIDKEMTLEDKYAACEKSYDQCVFQCEDKDMAFDECASQCEVKLYRCQSELEESIESEEKEITE